MWVSPPAALGEARTLVCPIRVIRPPNCVQVPIQEIEFHFAIGRDVPSSGRKQRSAWSHTGDDATCSIFRAGSWDFHP